MFFFIYSYRENWEIGYRTAILAGLKKIQKNRIVSEINPNVFGWNSVFEKSQNYNWEKIEKVAEKSHI